MTEHLLQYIWQFQYFNRTGLKLINGDQLQIIHQGNYNSNQGPDFLQAKIKINEIQWVGNIELHVHASDWKKHAHEEDENYNNIILHVVWIDDLKETNLPTLVLNELVSKIFLNRFQGLMESKTFVPCSGNIDQVKSIILQSWKERLIVERLERRTEQIKLLLAESKNHWEEIFWWMLARNFGIYVNSDAFEAIARSISVNILARHKNQLHQLEALLFGQAGLLEMKFEEDYPVMLQKEYRFLKMKYGLTGIQLPIYFLRMRPGNFPTVRLAQLAMLIHGSVHLFSIIKSIEAVSEITKLLSVTANDYWHYHYMLDEKSDFHPKRVGQQMINNIVINTITPVLFAYGHFYNEEAFKNKAMNWLLQLPAESNSIIDGWKLTGIISANAFDSQAMIELKNQYCNEKRCLQCAIGNSLLRKP